MPDLSLLKTLCTTDGISGDETAVRDRILQEIRPYIDDYSITPLGNLIAFKKGASRPKTKLMAEAHMDEVGMTVTHITKEGLLKFEPVGGIDPRVLAGTSVTVAGRYPGVIDVKPIHLIDRSDQCKAVPITELYVDIGAKDEADAERHIALGNSITFSPFFDMQHGTIKSRALDDRAGCFLLIEWLKKPLPYDMIFVFSVQEEIGLRGAKTAAYTVAPQAAIVVETTTAADIAGVSPEKQVCHVGKGPVLSFMDRATIYDREYFHMALQIAENAGIPCQVKQAIAGGNDSGAIHTARGGIRTIAVSLPCRYLHSPVGLISEEDLLHTAALLPLLSEKIAETDPSVLQNI